MTNTFDYKQIRILLVDDMVSIRNLIRSMLRSFGYMNVSVAEDGSEAWRILNEEHIDLIISDWEMPIMKGIELLNKVRSERRLEDLPFIMVTGEVAEEKVAQAAETEVDGYLLKPFSPKRLSELMDRVLELRNNPSVYQQYINSGRELKRSGDYEGALEALNMALEVNAEKPLAHLHLGLLYEEQGNLRKAKAAYARVLSINPRHIKALQGLANVHSKEGDERGLFEALRVLVELSPRNVERQMILGRLALKQNEKELSRMCFRKVLSLEPDNEELVLQIGKMFLDSEMVEEAEQIFADYSKRYPGNIDFQIHLAETYRKNGLLSWARDHYLKLLEISEDKARIHYCLSQVYIDCGIKRLAQSHLESAVLLDPEFTEAEKALQHLDELIQQAKEVENNKTKGT